MRSVAVPRRAAVLLVPAALVVLGLLARAAADRAFAAFTAYRPAFAFARAPQEPGSPLTPRVVLVVLDGLGAEASRSMPFLNELRSRGASLDCRIGVPSLSLPARAVLMTGAWADVHGQATNYNARPLAEEHLFQLARAAGRSTALAAGDKTQVLFAPHVTHAAVYEEPPETAPFAAYRAARQRDLAAALALVRAQPDLAQVELILADDAGHGWGTRSTEYAQAALLVDAALREVASAADLEHGTLVVTGDHGHVAAGGHGGPEPEVMLVPLVMAGRGVRTGVTGTCHQVDVAPTLAVLLGLGLPAAGQGAPLLDALDLDPALRRAVLRNLAIQRHAFVTGYRLRLARFSAADQAPQAGAAPAGAPASEETEADLERRLRSLSAMEAGARAEGERRQARGRWARAALVLALLLALLAAAFRFGLATRDEARRAAASAAGGLALYHAVLPALGLAYSLTAVNKDEWLRQFLMKDMALGVACCSAAAAVLCLHARRRGAGFAGLCRLAWLCAALFCAAFVAKAAFAYARHDVFPRWSLPDQWWGMAFYLDVLVITAVGLSAPALAAIAALARLVPPARPAPAAGR